DRPEWVHSIWGPTAGVEENTAIPVRIVRDEQGLHVIATNGALNGEVRVLDATGRQVVRTPLRGERADITLDTPRGLYLAEVVVAEGRRVQRFVW
ncbi:MAG TPA: T9SS type A sorting domain-containing protein, partial [Flavobacteriales bacterium]|nr:T9SS type A sorting domain-containing protein [Flavobacteriales bacterium]